MTARKRASVTRLVYVSIGNSDDKLSQSEWAVFLGSVREVLRRHASAVHGEWYSAPDAGYQNACFCVEFSSASDLAVKVGVVQMSLERTRQDYQQDSVAWAVAEQTEFI